MAPSLASSSSPAPAASVFSHILHPTDFSPEAFPAFAHAVRLAVAAKGHLTIVHAAPDGSAAGYEWEQFPKVRALLAKWGMLPDWATEDAVFDTLGVRVMKADLAGWYDEAVSDARSATPPVPATTSTGGDTPTN